MQLDPDLIERHQAMEDPYSTESSYPTRGDLMRTSPANPYGLDPPLIFDFESLVVCILHFIRVYFDILLSLLSKGYQESLSLLRE